MRKFKMLFLPFLFLSLALSSCSSDDDNGTPEADKIVGLWKISDVFIQTPLGELSVYDQIVENVPCALDSEFYFQEDKTVKVIAFTPNEADDCIAQEPQFGTWDKQNDVYTFTAEGMSFSNVNFINDTNFTVQTEMEGQQVKVKLSKQTVN